jgi:phosphoribosylanthranilate isomerase
MAIQVKICGITKPEQGQAIAQLGATALGFICVPASVRYVTPLQIRSIIQSLSVPIDCIGVFADAPAEEIVRIVTEAELNAVQLHGQESPEFCQTLRQSLAGIKVFKAVRVKTLECLERAETYICCVDTLLLDAYHPQLLGGTGQTIDWKILKEFRPSIPWFLAGGLTPENVLEALSMVQPSGIDLSSGVERAPGDKDLEKVDRLFEQLRSLR